MKKTSYIFISTAIVFFFAACGPSETEKKAEEEKVRHEADSIKAKTTEVVASQIDSLKNENKNSDSLVKEEKK